MQQLVKNWLNSNREYYTGLALLKLCKADAALIALLQKGPNAFNRKKLDEWLHDYYTNSMQHGTTTKVRESTTTPSKHEIDKGVEKYTSAQPAAGGHQRTALDVQKDYSDTELYAACKRDADKLYKEVMNDRAVLFSGVRNLLPHEDPNRPDLIKAREKTSIDIALKSQQYSKLYDKAEYVRVHGRLPHTEKETEDTNIESIPDSLVKQELDNLRKNLNKLKHREPTADRVALIAKHTETLKALEARWLLLKPQK